MEFSIGSLLSELAEPLRRWVVKIVGEVTEDTRKTQPTESTRQVS